MCWWQTAGGLVLDHAFLVLRTEYKFSVAPGTKSIIFHVLLFRSSCHPPFCLVVPIFFACNIIPFSEQEDEEQERRQGRREVLRGWRGPQGLRGELHVPQEAVRPALQVSSGDTCSSCRLSGLLIVHRGVWFQFKRLPCTRSHQHLQGVLPVFLIPFEVQRVSLSLSCFPGRPLHRHLPLSHAV